jgi:hypothetical protein
MANVKVTSHLRRFFPDLGRVEEVEGETVAKVVAALDQRHPGMARYLIDDQGRLRAHVNIFVNGEGLHDREQLGQQVGRHDDLFIFQALSGG